MGDLMREVKVEKSIYINIKWIGLFGHLLCSTRGERKMEKKKIFYFYWLAALDLIICNSMPSHLLYKIWTQHIFIIAHYSHRIQRSKPKKKIQMKNGFISKGDVSIITHPYMHAIWYGKNATSHQIGSKKRNREKGKMQKVFRILWIADITIMYRHHHHHPVRMHIE